MLLSWGPFVCLNDGHLCVDLTPVSPCDCACGFWTVACPRRCGDSLRWYLAPCTVPPALGHDIDFMLITAILCRYWVFSAIWRYQKSDGVCSDAIGAPHLCPTSILCLLLRLLGLSQARICICKGLAPSLDSKLFESRARASLVHYWVLRAN